MASSDFFHSNTWIGRSPLVRACSFGQSLPDLHGKHFPDLSGLGDRQAVLSHPICHASYPVPVRQYQPLQSHFLQRIPCGKPPCDLLTVRDVTPARKGLPPSGNLPPIVYASIKFVYLNFLSRLRRVCTTCSCRAHTSRQPSNAGGFRRLAFTKPINDRGKQR